MSDYVKWLESQKTVTPSQSAGHRNFTKKLVPLIKQFEQFLGDYSDKTSRIPLSKFSPQEDKALREALLLLKKASYPVASLPPVKEEARVPFLRLADTVEARVAKKAMSKK